MDNPFQSPAILSLCPGIRGLERGLDRAIGPVRTIAYVEIEAFCAYNLVAQMEENQLAPAPVFTNLKTFNAKPFRNRIDGITAGYPCQGESTAGKKRFAKDNRFLWPYISRIVEVIRPAWCFFENVPNHLNGTFPIVLSALQNMGYTVEAGIFSANEVGAPHRRERLFILALAHGTCSGIRRLSKHQPGPGWKTPEQNLNANGSGETLEHTGNGTERDISGVTQKSEKQRKPCDTGKDVGHTFSTAQLLDKGKQTTQPIAGSAGGQKLSNTYSLRECTRYNESAAGIANQDGEKWPAGRGLHQHPWEHPRVESSMGYTIDGHNFTEDLCRAIGNSVVEQTAELAFRTLLKKFSYE